jgi:hypothetical protein
MTYKDAYLYQPSAQRASYLKGTYYMSIVEFNNLPVSIKRLYDNPTAFKLVVKIFLCDYSFYTSDEYFNYVIVSSLSLNFYCSNFLVNKRMICKI